MRACSIYVREDKVYVITISLTRRGSSILTDRVAVLDLHGDPSTLGEGVVDALEHYEDGVPDLADWRDSATPMLRFTGYRSLRAFHAGTRYIGVSENSGEVRIAPTVAMRGDFYGCPPEDEATVGLDPVQIGHAIMDRLALCTPMPEGKPGRRSTGRQEESSLSPAPVSFGYKSSWLAVRRCAQWSVARALGLTDVQPSDWVEGMRTADEGRTFVSPPVDGWTLVLGSGFPHAGDAAWLPFLADLSRTLGEVQYFGTHRVSSYQAWARAKGGDIIRAYGYGDGETLSDVGKVTKGEVRAQRTTDIRDEDYVLAVAAEWSIDPSALDEYESSGLGFIGDPPVRLNESPQHPHPSINLPAPC